MVKLKKKNFKFSLNSSADLVYRKKLKQEQLVLKFKTAFQLMWKLHLTPSHTCAPKRAITLARDFQKKVHFTQAQMLATKIKELCQGCQITRQLNRAVPYIPKIIRVNNIMERLQIDLIDMAPGQELQMRENFGRFRYILSMTECLTRYCTLIPLRSKTAAELKPVVQMFFITEDTNHGGICVAICFIRSLA